MNKNYTAALYCRLSKDDGSLNESSSISSQKELLRRFAEENNIAIYDYYIDDGYSGTNFERPAFKRMIEDIENRIINCVITKDLSRLGRNYLQSGAYIEMYFPEKNVRYISINDGIDSNSEIESDIMPFKNILNEMYAKDTSKKVKSAIQSRMKEGIYIGSNPPFGFLKDPNDKHHLIIREETRDIIELIFNLALEGYGSGLIAKELVKRKIPRPSAWVENPSKSYNVSEETKYNWTHRAVIAILRDPVYCGYLERNKRPTLSFKNKKRKYIKKDERYVVRNTHQPIVSEEVYNQVNEMINQRKCTNKTGLVYDNIFKGVIKCEDCGYALTPSFSHRRTINDPIKRTVYYCSEYKRKGVSGCSPHRIEAIDLHNLVLEDIKHHANLAIKNKDELIKKVVSKIELEKDSKEDNLIEKLDEKKDRIMALENMFKTLYMDRLEGRISTENFEMMNQNLSKEQRILRNEINMIETELTEDKLNKDNLRKFVENLSQYADIKELNAYIINQVIDKILVYERETVDGEEVQNIEIHYKFIGTLN